MPLPSQISKGANVIHQISQSPLIWLMIIYICMNSSKNRGDFWWTSNFPVYQWFWDIFCWMLLACMQCNFEPNGIFNILKIHTCVYVIPHFQGISFTFKVKKSLKYKIVEEKSHIMKKRFHRRTTRGKVYIALIL